LLEGLLTQTSLLSLEEYRGLSREEKISFWVNTYTTWLLRILADLEPGRSSLLPISPPFLNYRLQMFGEAYSLQEMQKKIWEEFRDERIFFLMANGTQAGVPFPQDFLTAPQTEETLNRVTIRYLRDPQNVELKKKELWLSPFLRDLAPFLMLNYGGSDSRRKSFGGSDLALVNFIFQHAETEEIRSALKQLGFKIRYFPPDFTLKKSVLETKKTV